MRCLHFLQRFCLACGQVQRYRRQQRSELTHQGQLLRQECSASFGPRHSPLCEVGPALRAYLGKWPLSDQGRKLPQPASVLRKLGTGFSSDRPGLLGPQTPSNSCHAVHDEVRHRSGGFTRRMGHQINQCLVGLVANAHDHRNLHSGHRPTQRQIIKRIEIQLGPSPSEQYQPRPDRTSKQPGRPDAKH